jgi:hypothetical protein
VGTSNCQQQSLALLAHEFVGLKCLCGAGLRHADLGQVVALTIVVPVPGERKLGFNKILNPSPSGTQWLRSNQKSTTKRSGVSQTHHSKTPNRVIFLIE